MYFKWLISINSSVDFQLQAIKTRVLCLDNQDVVLLANPLTYTVREH